MCSLTSVCYCTVHSNLMTLILDKIHIKIPKRLINTIQYSTTSNDNSPSGLFSAML